MMNKSHLLKSLACYALLTASYLPTPVSAIVLVNMETDLGVIHLELYDDIAPIAVDNFLNYANSGAYDGTFIHRSIPGFVVQGGGYVFDPDDGGFFDAGTSHIPTDPPIPNEFNLSNTRGTLAMATVAGDPDSATSEWFFNVVDNSGTLDTQNGGFTVFGQVLGNGMDIIDAVNALQRCVDIAPIPALCGAFPDTPFIGYDGSGEIQPEHLVKIISITTVPIPPAVWLFGSGLLGLIGISRRKTA